MVYLIWGTLGILAFVFKRNRLVTALVFVFIAIIFIFPDGNKIPDFKSYQFAYENQNTLGITEPLYNFFSALFFNMGLSYLQFRGFLTVIFLVLIALSFYRLTPYPTLAFFMYSIYPMTLDVVQIRFAIGYSIVFWGFGFLVQYTSKKNNRYLLIYLISVILGVGFHYGCLIYAILIVTAFDIHKHRFVYLFIIPAVLVFCMMTVDRFTSIASDIIGDHKAEMWVQRERSISMLAHMRIIVSRCIPLAFSVFLSYLQINQKYRMILGDETNCLGMKYDHTFISDREEWINENAVYNLKANSLMFVCIFYICSLLILEINIEGSYERFARLGLLISSALITRELFYIEENNRVLAVILFLLMYIAYWAAIMLFMTGGVNNLFLEFVFRPVMENNKVFAIENMTIFQ